MLSKIVGCIFVIGSGFCVGLSKAHEIRCHEGQLKEIQSVIKMIKIEREYTNRPLEDVFESVAEKSNGSVKQWLHEMSSELKEKNAAMFPQMWVQMITKHFKHWLLSREEMEELKAVGMQLEYMECVEVYLYRLNEHINQVHKDGLVKRKLYQSLGIIGGIFLAVLLL